MPSILIVTGIFPPDIGGPATYAEIIARALSERGIKVTVVTYSSVRKSPQDILLHFGVVRVWKKIPWLFRHLIYLWQVVARTRKHDILYSLSSINGGIACRLASRLFRKKFFVRIVGDYAWQVAAAHKNSRVGIEEFQRMPKFGWIWFLNKIQRRIVRVADLVVVPSRYLADLVSGWGVLPSRIKIIPNAVEFVPVDLSKAQARKQIGIAGNILLSIGRLVPWKGFRMLIKIMPELLKTNQFFRLIIIGEGPDKKVLQKMIQNLHLEHKVFLIGKSDKQILAKYFAAADLFILNSGYEGFSHQILEAMAAGLAVITTDAGGNPEIVQQGVNGLMVGFNDELALLEAIKILHNDAALQKHFIQAGYKTAARYTVKVMTEHTLEAFQ